MDVVTNARPTERLVVGSKNRDGPSIPGPDAFRDRGPADLDAWIRAGRVENSAELQTAIGGRPWKSSSMGSTISFDAPYFPASVTDSPTWANAAKRRHVRSVRADIPRRRQSERFL
jgi:hypothetical protein